jgi:hypothetical protein
MGTTNAIERKRAIAWIIRQMSWERTLERLRDQSKRAEASEEPVAA